jgi:hypothetical protein
MIVSIEEYRKTLNDYESTEEQITRRVEYIESFCRNVIKSELNEYVKKDRNSTIENRKSPSR